MMERVETHTLTATTTRVARKEAERFAPCELHGFDGNDEVVFISSVRAMGDNSYVATATRNRSQRPVRFVAVVKRTGV